MIIIILFYLSELHLKQLLLTYMHIQLLFHNFRFENYHLPRDTNKPKNGNNNNNEN